VGTLVAPAIAAVSHARGARMFHPDGSTFLARVTPDSAARPEFGHLGERLSGDALARFSGALWRRGFEHLDVLGIALRFRSVDEGSPEPRAGDQDLLFATIRSPFTMGVAPFTTDAGDYLANTYWAVSPFSIGEGRHVKFRLRPRRACAPRAPLRDERLARAVAEGEVAWGLEVRRTFTLTWSPLATVLITRPSGIDEEALRFSPFRCGRGVVPRGFVHAMRRPTYAASQSARPRHQRAIFVSSRSTTAAIQGATDMGTDKRNEILTTYTSDVHALITHGQKAIQRQVENLKNVSHADAKTAVVELERVLAGQKTAIEARITALGGAATQPVKDAVSAVAGVAAGLINAVRGSETAKSIRDDHTFFSQLGVAWLMMHTTALSLGDAETARVAERGYGETARCIMHIDTILPKIVTEEIRESVSTAGDATAQSRAMLIAAWNRDTPTFSAPSTAPTQSRPIHS